MEKLFAVFGWRRMGHSTKYSNRHGLRRPLVLWNQGTSSKVPGYQMKMAATLLPYLIFLEGLLMNIGMKSSVPDHAVFIFDYSLMGWIAFGVALICFAAIIAWHYKQEADQAKKDLLTTRIHISETNPLMHHPKASAANGSFVAQYHQIASDDDVTEDEWVNRSIRSYAYPSYRIASGKGRRYVWVTRARVLYFLDHLLRGGIRSVRPALAQLCMQSTSTP